MILATHETEICKRPWLCGAYLVGRRLYVMMLNARPCDMMWYVVGSESTSMNSAWRSCSSSLDCLPQAVRSLACGHVGKGGKLDLGHTLPLSSPSIPWAGPASAACAMECLWVQRKGPGSHIEHWGEPFYLVNGFSQALSLRDSKLSVKVIGQPPPSAAAAARCLHSWVVRTFRSKLIGCVDCFCLCYMW